MKSRLTCDQQGSGRANDLDRNILPRMTCLGQAAETLARTLALRAELYGDANSASLAADALTILGLAVRLDARLRAELKARAA